MGRHVVMTPTVMSETAISGVIRDDVSVHHPGSWCQEDVRIHAVKKTKNTRS